MSLKEIFHNSSNYVCQNSSDTRIICHRINYNNDFKHLLQNIEQHIQQGEIIHTTTNTTLVKIKFNNNDLVIKKFKTKNFWHRIKRSLRQSRAARCWENAHYLLLYNIATPKPLAIIEKKSMGLRTASYYVMEYVDAEPLDDFLKHHDNENFYINKLIYIFKTLKKQHLRYRDPKTIHFLATANDLFVIDLDDMKKLSSWKYFLTSAWKKDRKKIIKYWSKAPQIQKLLKETL